jgi:hypothetical protein
VQHVTRVNERFTPPEVREQHRLSVAARGVLQSRRRAYNRLVEVFRNFMI